MKVLAVKCIRGILHLERQYLKRSFAKPAAAPKAESEKKEEKKVEPPNLKPLIRKLKIYRYNPESVHQKKPFKQDFTVNVNDCGPMVLDVLEKIKKDQDGSLTFRRSCREGICGSCGMNINGVNRLACLTRLKKLRGTIKIWPLPHMYVIKDLIVDFTRFLQQHRKIKPYLIRETDGCMQEGDQTLLQSMRDRDKLDGNIECILCACCSTSCPEYWWHGHSDEPKDFLGPAALLNAYRWIVDSRDHGTKERLDDLRNYYSVYRCHQIMNCTKCCPKRLNPGQAIANLRLFLAGKKKRNPDMDGTIKAQPEKAKGSECDKPCPKF